MTLIPFTPNSNVAPPFSTLITMDGTAYTLITMWNFYRSDWYIQIFDQSGNLVINQPLIGSPPGYDIYLAPGIFTMSTLVYRVGTGNFEVGP